ncbi:hypothetical protein HPP92_013639 [Vanilla planifolia]|uniref:Uncharacterized protein n=1 Tax=Vanilla planifolia TaxID=51239 RepID=A0A835UYL2_VANPL|nr:hypothetical protein HPP92_014076 [Vanilla planifolia]KAG0478920.1 hypothetical protein HPP92_013639 [Vanilla planifolia]
MENLTYCMKADMINPPVDQPPVAPGPKQMKRLQRQPSVMRSTQLMTASNSANPAAGSDDFPPESRMTTYVRRNKGGTVTCYRPGEEPRAFHQKPAKNASTRAG